MICGSKIKCHRQNESASRECAILTARQHSPCVARLSDVKGEPGGSSRRQKILVVSVHLVREQIIRPAIFNSYQIYFEVLFSILLRPVFHTCTMFLAIQLAPTWPFSRSSDLSHRTAVRLTLCVSHSIHFIPSHRQPSALDRSC